MNYNKLKYFYEIARIKNISHAAEILYVSQSSLSKAISDLEKDLDVTLFIRTNRNLILTAAGEELLKRVTPLFSSERELRTAVYEAGHRNTESKQITLNVGFMHFEATTELPLTARAYSREHPAVIVKTLRRNKMQLFSDLRKDHLDAAFVIYTPDEIPAGFHYKQFSEYHVAAILRSDHPLAKRFEITLSELQNEPFLMHGTPETSGEYDFVLSWCSRNHLSPNIIASFEYSETLLMMVQSGLGISLLSDAAAIHSLTGLSCVPIENAPSLYGGIFYKQNKKAPAVEAFINYYLSSRQDL